MSRVGIAFLRALASQLHPRMLGLLLLPFGVAVVFWIGAAWFVWDPLTGWLRESLFGATAGGGWLATLGLGDVGAGVTALLAVLLLAPLMFVVALILVSLAATPIVNRHLGGGAYRDVQRRGGWSLAAGVGTALATFGVFAVGYLLTAPLWLVPVVGLAVPWLWWSWLTARILRVDSLAEHASAEESDALIARHRGEYFLLAALVCALNYVPPLFLVTPVLSALAFGHFSLAALRAHRSGPAAGRLNSDLDPETSTRQIR